MSKITNTAPHIVIYTDGACLGNPGIGGWAASIRMIENGETKKRLISDSVASTTNNQMELCAAIAALRWVTRTQLAPIAIFSDSKYLIDGMARWLPGWIANGWKKSNGKPVANQELWRELHSLIKELDVKWAWVKSHDGDPWNEEVDRLAKLEAKWLKKSISPLRPNASRGNARLVNVGKASAPRILT